jgi:hypothetical protein
MIIKTRISGIDVPIDDLVVHWRAAGPLVEADVVSAIEPVIVVLDISVIYVAVDGPVAVNVIGVHVATDDVSIDDDIVVAIVHVNVANANPRSRAVDPAPAMPSVIVDPVVMPVAIAIEPRANDETNAKGDCQSPRGAAVITDVGIVDWHVDVRGLIRNDADVVVFDQHLLLRRTNEITNIVGHVTQTLDGGHNVSGLVDIGLANGSGPIDSVGHHVDHRWIVRDGLDADVPGLVVDADGAIRADPASGFVNVIHESGSHEDLGQ